MDIASLGIVIDTSQAKDAVRSLDKLADVGEKVQRSIVATENANKRLSKSWTEGDKAAAQNNRTIERYVRALQTSVATTTLSTRESMLYRLALQGASSAQLQAADSALRMNEAYEKGVALGNRLKVGLIATSSTAAAVAVAMAKAAIDGIDALNDLSDATGSTVENISALEDIAARTGTSMDAVSTALIKFNGVLKDVRPGSGADAALKALNLNAKELIELDPAQALLKTAMALSQFQDNGNKARIIQELFGKSLREVAPLLKDLADKGKLVATVTTEQAQEAEAFNKELAALSKNVTDASRSLVGPMVGALNETIAKFREGAKEGKGFFEIASDRYWSNVSKFYGISSDAAEGYRQRLSEIDKQLQGGESRLLVRNALLREQAELQAKLATLEPKTPTAAQQEAQKPSLPNLPVLEKKGASGLIAKAAADAKRAQEERIRQRREEATAIGKAVEEENDMLAKLVLSERQATEARNRQTASYLDGLIREQQGLEELNAKTREHVEEIGLSKEALASLVLQRLDNTIAMEKERLAMLQLGEGSLEEIALMERRLELMKEQRDLTAKGQVAQAQVDTQKDQDKASKDFADTLHNDLKGAFSAAFRDSQNPLAAFGDALANVMYSRAATSLSEALVDAVLPKTLTSAASGQSGSGGGILEFATKFLSSFDGGGYTGSGSRSGGIDGKGGFISILHPQETVVDHTKGQSLGAGSSISLTVNVDARGSDGQGSEEQAKQLGAMVGNIVIAKLVEQKRNGGLLAA